MSCLSRGRPALVVGFAMLLSACASSPPTTPAGTLRPGDSFPFNLSTHCGVDEARIAGAYYRAVHPLFDGNGNPPPGWGNPYQPGTMTISAHGTAVFTDSAGHRMIFRLRPRATAFEHICS